MRSFTRYSIICLGAGLVLSGAALGASNPNHVGIGGLIGAAVTNAADHPDRTQSLNRCQAAVLLNYRQTRLISYQMELAIIGKGYRLPDMKAYDADAPKTIFTTSITAFLTYLELPVMAKISVPVRGKYIPYLLGGGYGSYLLSSKWRLPDSLLFTYGDYTLANVSQLEAGAVVGTGLDIKAGHGFVTFETRYEIGLTSVIKKEPQKNRAWTFSVGYWF